MPRRPRRNHSPAFEAKVAIAAIKGEKTMIELSQEFDIHPNQIKQWRDQLLEGATGVFGEAAKPAAEPVNEVKTLHAKIGERTLENDCRATHCAVSATGPGEPRKRLLPSASK